MKEENIEEGQPMNFSEYLISSVGDIFEERQEEFLDEKFEQSETQCEKKEVFDQENLEKTSMTEVEWIDFENTSNFWAKIKSEIDELRNKPQ